MTTTAAPSIFHPQYSPTRPNVSTPASVLLSASQTQVAAAAGIALARVMFHDQRGRRADQDLGKRNISIDHVGALAEILIRDLFDMWGIDYTAAPLFAASVPLGPDLVINRRTFNIKAVPNNQVYCMINEEQRLNPRKASEFLLPVRFTSATTAIILEPIPAAHIEQWELREGRNAYRSCPVSHLAPLHSLNQLTGGIR